MKGVTDKRSATKSIPNQPNVKETWFACLEALVMNMASNMATHVKPTSHVLGDFSTQGFNPKFFYGVGFLRPLGPNEIKLDIS